jgi:hypothetical protein
LSVKKLAGTKGFFPRSERRLTIVGVKSTDPTLTQGLLFGETGKGFPPVAGVEDHSVGVCGPGNLGTEFDGVAIVVLAFDEGLLSQLAAGDVDDRDGDSDNLVDFVARGLIGDEDGARHGRSMRVGIADFEAGVGYAVERAQEVGLALGEFLGDDLGDMAAEVRGDGKVVHLGEALVHADVAQVAIEVAEADGDAIVDGIELGESLGGQSFEA